MSNATRAIEATLARSAPATPLPWKVGELSECAITNRGIETITVREYDDEADRETALADLKYAVRAANALPELLAACLKVEASEPLIRDGFPTGDFVINRETMRMLMVAIQKASA